MISSDARLFVLNSSEGRWGHNSYLVADRKILPVLRRSDSGEVILSSVYDVPSLVPNETCQILKS